MKRKASLNQQATLLLNFADAQEIKGQKNTYKFQSDKLSFLGVQIYINIKNHYKNINH